MTDLIISGPGQLQVRSEAPSTGITGPDDVVVQVDHVTLCGSDYALYKGTYSGPRGYPLRFGHEWSGTVLDAGGAARRLIGKAVTGDCSRWCGNCPQCAVDRNRCEHIEKFGLTVDGFSVRERVVDQRYLYADEFSLGPGILALTEFFAVAHRGLGRLGRLDPECEALIVGGGALGMAVHLLLTEMSGMKRIVLHEADPAKRETVRTVLGGDADVREPLAAEAIAGIRSYRAIASHARYPVVIECSGTPDGMNNALALAAPGGTVLWLGLASESLLRPDLIVTKGLSIVGSIGGTGDFPDVMRFLAGQEGRAAGLVTHRYPAERAEHALSAAPGADGGPRIKAQLRF